MKAATSVEEYLKPFSGEQRAALEKIRKAIKEAAPEAEESISYGMPGYKLNGPLVYFGGFKHHCSFFPAGSQLTDLSDEIKEYKTSKGTLQFPLHKPIPVTLIKKIVKARVKENKIRLKTKTEKKKPVKAT